MFGSRESDGSLRVFCIQHSELEFGPAVASGEFGTVYPGRYFGARVAIKHIKAIKYGRKGERDANILSRVSFLLFFL